MPQSTTWAKIVAKTSIPSRKSVMQLALFNADGTPFAGGAAGVHVAPVTTVNATDLASAEALANANKTTINALITSLQNAHLLASS